MYIYIYIYICTDYAVANRDDVTKFVGGENWMCLLCERPMR